MNKIKVLLHVVLGLVVVSLVLFLFNSERSERIEVTVRYIAFGVVLGFWLLMVLVDVILSYHNTAVFGEYHIFLVIGLLAALLFAIAFDQINIPYKNAVTMSLLVIVAITARYLRRRQIKVGMRYALKPEKERH